MMNRMSIVGMAGAAELAAHFLSLSWGFGVIVVAFLWVAGTARASMAVTTAKVTTTENRVDGVVSALGTTNSNVTSATNTANSANSTANSAQTTANNALPKSGGTITGNLVVNGTLTTFNDLGVNGSANITSNCNIAGNIGSSYAMPQGAPSTQASPPNGTATAAQYAGNFYTGSGASNWAINITAKVNQIIGMLHNAGVTT